MSEEICLEHPEELGNTLHQLLIGGDVTASAKIAEAFLHSVADKLRKGFPNLDDPHLVDTAVADAFINYFGRPQQYDPTRWSRPGRGSRARPRVRGRRWYA